MKEKQIIDIMAQSYKQSKIFISECEMGARNNYQIDLATSRKIVEHIDMIVSYLNERDRFIIYHEVILGKTGNWYRDSLSQPSYYRHRKEAYKTFLHNLTV